jgi:hypothetical protein
MGPTRCDLGYPQRHLPRPRPAPGTPRTSQSPPAIPFPSEAPPPAPGMLGPSGVTRARRLRPLRLWPRWPCGDGSIMASMQVRGVCCIWVGEGAAERVRAFGRGRCPGLRDTRTGCGGVPVAGLPPSPGRVEGARWQKRKVCVCVWGWSSVCRSGHQPAGKLGDKEGLGQGRVKFGVGSEVVVSKSPPCAHRRRLLSPGQPQGCLFRRGARPGGNSCARRCHRGRAARRGAAGGVGAWESVP